MQIEIPFLIFLIETRLVAKEIELIKCNLSMSNGVFVNYVSFENGRKGRLCLFWTESLQVLLKSFSLHHIDVVIKDISQTWRFIWLYGCLEDYNKNRTWSLMK